jgi:alkyl hydroperoxide reductase subunit AhpC
MQPRKTGGVGPDLQLPLLADGNMKISKDYGVLIEEEGIALRGLFLIDPKGVLRWPIFVVRTEYVTDLQICRQMTVNDLPVGRSVEETIRLIKAFQFAVCLFSE